MTALATALSSNVSPEAVAWADSHLPNSNELGTEQTPSKDLGEFWNGFKFERSKMVVDGGRKALSTVTQDLIDMSTLMRSEAKRLGIQTLDDPMQMINLTKVLDKEQFAIIVLQGLTSFGEKMTQIERDLLFDLLRNKLNNSEES